MFIISVFSPPLAFLQQSYVYASCNCQTFLLYSFLLCYSFMLRHKWTLLNSALLLSVSAASWSPQLTQIPLCLDKLGFETFISRYWTESIRHNIYQLIPSFCVGTIIRICIWLPATNSQFVLPIANAVFSR